MPVTFAPTDSDAEPYEPASPKPSTVPSDRARKYPSPSGVAARPATGAGSRPPPGPPADDRLPKPNTAPSAVATRYPLSPAASTTGPETAARPAPSGERARTEKVHGTPGWSVAND